MEPDYIPTCKGPGTPLPWRRDIPRLLSFNWALFPAARTNNHFNRSDTALYNISLQPSPKHQSHTIYRKLEDSLNLAYFESNRGSSSPHEDSPASCPPSCTIGRGRGHPPPVPRLRAAAAAHARRQVAGGEPQWKGNCTAPLTEYRRV